MASFSAFFPLVLFYTKTFLSIKRNIVLDVDCWLIVPLRSWTSSVRPWILRGIDGLHCLNSGKKFFFSISKNSGPKCPSKKRYEIRATRNIAAVLIQDLGLVQTSNFSWEELIKLSELSSWKVRRLAKSSTLGLGLRAIAKGLQKIPVKYKFLYLNSTSIISYKPFRSRMGRKLIWSLAPLLYTYIPQSY